MRKPKITTFVTALCIMIAMFAVCLPMEAGATELDKTEETVKLGKSITVNLLNNDERAVTWSVEDGSVLEITGSDAGHAVVRGKKIGTTDVIATTQWWSYRCQITVVKPKKRVVYKEDGVTVKVTGLTIDEYGDAQILCNVKNSTSKTIKVYANEITLNGYMMVDDMIGTVAPKSQINDGIECYKSYLKKNKIKNIKSAGFILHITNSNYKTIAESNRIKVKF